MSILEIFRTRAKRQPKKIVFPEAQDARILQAVRRIHEAGVARPILVGSKGAIATACSRAGVTLDPAIPLYDPASASETDSFIAEYYQLRKAKGMTQAQARLEIRRPLVFGAMLVRNQLADACIAGAACPTSDTIRAALRCVGTAIGSKLLSSFFLMVPPESSPFAGSPLLFADCAVNPEPTPPQLAQIAIQTAASFRALFPDAEPCVAMLSFSTKGSASHPKVDLVREAARIAAQKAPRLVLDGELQLDAAIVESIAHSKAPGSLVAGRANILIFPDLSAGNIGYKLVQRFARAEAIGPFFQGLAAPVNDLSRGCSVSDIFDTAAVTSLLAAKS